MKRRRQSTYARKRKSLTADRYGTYREGKQTIPEIIAGKTINTPLGKGHYRHA